MNTKIPFCTNNTVDNTQTHFLKYISEPIRKTSKLPRSGMSIVSSTIWWLKVSRALVASYGLAKTMMEMCNQTSSLKLALQPYNTLNLSNHIVKYYFYTGLWIFGYDDVRVDVP